MSDLYNPEKKTEAEVDSIKTSMSEKPPLAKELENALTQVQQEATVLLSSIDLTEEFPEGEHIVIDTNIFYHHFGLGIKGENPANVQKIQDLSVKNVLYISTPSLIEAIIYYRNDLAKIQICLEPVITERLKLVNIGFLPLKNAELKKIYDAKDLSEVDALIEEIFEQKILQESKMITYYCALLVEVAVGSILIGTEKYQTNNPDEKTAIFLKSAVFLNQFLDQIMLRTYEGIKRVYLNQTEGVRGRKEHDRLIKKLLSDFLREAIEPILFAYYDNCSLTASFPLDEIIIYLKSDKFLENPFNIFKVKGKNKKKLINVPEGFFDAVDLNLLKNKDLTLEVKQYITEKIRLILSKLSLFKNDSIDGFLLSTLNLMCKNEGSNKSFLFLTADKNMKNALQQISPESHTLFHRLGLI